MNRLATGVSTVLAFLVLSLALATAASALPELHTSLGDLFPVSGLSLFRGAKVATISTALSAPITASEISFLLNCESLGSLCQYEWHMSGVEIEGKSCQTAGDALTVLLIAKNEMHFVWTLLSPLNLAADWLIAKTTVTCIKGAEELKITLEGQVLAKIEGVSSGVDTTHFTLNMKCTKPGNGKQEVKEYFNDEGKLVKGVLTANLGLGPETACVEVSKTGQFETNKMVEFLF